MAMAQVTNNPALFFLIPDIHTLANLASDSAKFIHPFDLL